MKKALLLIALLLLPSVLVQAQDEQGQILFWSDRDGDFDLYTSNGSGDPVNLTQNDAGDAWGVWSPDGSMIAFESDREGHRKIYVMNADGSDARSFTEPDARDTGPVAWSPDGEHLAFMSFLREDDASFLIVAAVDGSDVQKLTPGLPPEFLANTVRWSADGNLIVLEGPGDENNIQDIYSIHVDGSNFLNLTQNPVGDVWPDIAPDSSKIAFGSEQGGGNVDIMVINLDGSDLVNLTNTPDRYEARPVWSPDGSQIAFVSNSLQDTDDREIYVMNADGSDLRPLSSGDGQKDFPAWSPDGSQIAYQVTVADALDIQVVNVDGSTVQQLTQDAFADYAPQWKPE